MSKTKIQLQLSQKQMRKNNQESLLYFAIVCAPKEFNDIMSKHGIVIAQYDDIEKNIVAGKFTTQVMKEVSEIRIPTSVVEAKIKSGEIVLEK